MCVVFLAGPASAQDRVYELTNEHARPSFTNAGDVSVGGRPAQELSLPPLGKLDFESATPQALAAVDAKVARAHRALTAGPKCAALRSGAARSWHETFWVDHGLDLAFVAGLLALAWVLRRALRRHPVGLVFAAIPLLAAARLGHLSVRRAEQTREALAQGAAACATELPALDDGAQGEGVARRFSQVLDLQQRIDAAYERQDRRLERIFADARR